MVRKKYNTKTNQRDEASHWTEERMVPARTPKVSQINALHY